MRFNRRILVPVGLVLCFFICMTTNVSALISLPDPTLKYGAYTDGGDVYEDVYVAWANDDFWGYSGQLMSEIYNVTGDEAMNTDPKGTGTGNLDILLYSANTKNPGLEDAVPTQGGNITFKEGWWGQNDQDNDGTPDDVGGPVTVNQVMTQIDSNIPVFYLDLNQTGSNLDLFFTGQVMIFDPTGTTMKANFTFDSLGDGTGSSSPDRDGTFDQDSPGFVTAGGPLDVDAFSVALGTIESGGYVANHNLGSGQYDYITYSPLLNLGDYGLEDLFVVNFRLGHEIDIDESGKVDGKDWGAMNNGFEEIYLTGLYQPPIVPEPSTWILLGAGLAGLTFYRRKKS